MTKAKPYVWTPSTIFRDAWLVVRRAGKVIVADFGDKRMAQRVTRELNRAARA